tara:strand:- start:100 stop:354 length:255 start_codon:yes stop_codon:yes gene_type:complete
MTTEKVTEEKVVEEAPKVAKSKKSKYDFEEDGDNLLAWDVAIKTDDAEGVREWREYKVKASSQKNVLRLIGHDGYAPYRITVAE